MLAANKDWEVQELPLLHYEWNIVRTWAQHFLDDQVRQVDRLTDTVLSRLQLQPVTLPSLPSFPSLPLPQETWLSKFDDVEKSLSSFWKPLMTSDGLSTAVEEKVVQVEKFLHSFDRHDEIIRQEERKEDMMTSSSIIPNTQLTTSSDVAPSSSFSSSITPVEERKSGRSFKEVKQEFKKEVRRLDREDFFRRFSDSSNNNGKAFIDGDDFSDQMEESEVDKKIGEGRRRKNLIETLSSSSFSSYKSKLSAKARHYPQYS